MGWGPGYQPKDGDGPHDIFGMMSHEAVLPWLSRFLAKSKKVGDPRHCDWELVGLLQLLWEAHLDAPRALVQEALTGCDRLLADEEWINSWKHPAQHRRSLTLWQKVLSRALDRPTCGPRRRNRPVYFFDVAGDVERAAKLKDLKPRGRKISHRFVVIRRKPGKRKKASV